jgi:hypothetical protein
MITGPTTGVAKTGMLFKLSTTLRNGTKCAIFPKQVIERSSQLTDETLHGYLPVQISNASTVLSPVSYNWCKISLSLQQINTLAFQINILTTLFQ